MKLTLEETIARNSRLMALPLGTAGVLIGANGLTMRAALVSSDPGPGLIREPFVFSVLYGTDHRYKRHAHKLWDFKV